MQRMENKTLDDIVRDNVPKLHSYVRSRVKAEEDAEDIIQDTLYQFLRTFSVLDNPIAHVTSWLYTVAHNLIINNGKKHREESLPQLYAADDSYMSDLSEIMMASDSDNPEILMLRSMVWNELDKALAELPQEQRKAVTLTELEGLSVKEAAARMGVPQNTFLSRKHYAVVHIRKRLKTLYKELISNS